MRGGSCSFALRETFGRTPRNTTPHTTKAYPPPITLPRRASFVELAPETARAIIALLAPHPAPRFAPAAKDSKRSSYLTDVLQSTLALRRLP